MITIDQIENKSFDMLFRMLDGGNQQQVKANRLLQVLETNGILEDDPRIADTITGFRKKPKEDYTDSLISNQDFNEILHHNALIKKAVSKELIIPDFDSFCEQVEKIFHETKKNKGGKVADYIPQLARVNPEQYAVSICTVDGQRFSIGDARTNFCLQSSCKPINYCMALEELGEDKVHSHVGREPSGQSFNELTLNDSGLPHNPMINAGAMMSCSLIANGLEIADRFDKVSNTWSALCGRKPVYFNNAVYLSERKTADRNFALAYFMRENSAFPENTNLTETLEFYFQCCSIESCTYDLSVAAATLANAGTNPLTGDQIFHSSTIQNCLSLMLSCGMYDFSGEFAFKIGLPAKSGVSGALMLVIPNVMGISIWSPRLDSHGNTVRGVEFCKQLTEKYSFHQYDSLTGHSNKTNPRNKQKELKVSKMMELIWASSHGDLDEILRLESEGVDLEIADYDGRTPLHLAASENQEEVINYLLSRKVAISPKDRWGNTPLDDAKRSNHERVIKVLEKALNLNPKQHKNGKPKVLTEA